MAELILGKTASIEYSIHYGKVRRFILMGETLYDRTAKISTTGWEDKLIELIKELRLNDGDCPLFSSKLRNTGFHAFIYPLVEKGKLKLINVE